MRLSATDLANHLACAHLTTLDRGAALGLVTLPHAFRPDADVLAQRGLEHERQYLDYLEAHGRTVTRLEAAGDGASALERTLAAMFAGADIIAQATLVNERWLGRADVLVRVPRPSGLGEWSYEALDTKLARETKAGAVLQLCLYTELLAAMQGEMPERMHVVPRKPGFPLDSYRVDDYLAYYRFVLRRLVAAVDDDAPAGTYPEPVTHCEICRWRPACEKERRDDDHLSLVAGIAKLQMRELESRDVDTLARLAIEPIPIGWKPARGSRDSYTRVREQARVQLRGREAGRCLYELLALEPGRGLAKLPAPSPGDVFLDLEADPYVDDGGIEWLFGWVVAEPALPGTLALETGTPVYHRHWALDRRGERQAFEAVIDTIMERWAADPDMHVYHYGAYEPSALKRLMGRHATRADEIDRLLRAERFVDLLGVVKQSLRASVEDYSIKRIEPLFGYERVQPLFEAGASLRLIQRSLELGTPIDTTDADAKVAETYNRDDCLATLALRDWLERVRADVVAGGAAIERPTLQPGDPNETIGERERAARALAERLLAGIPDDALDRTPAEQAVWLLAHLLDWHRREDKSAWWEYYRLRELSDEELLDETAALAGLQHLERLGSSGRSVVDRYAFPLQETSIREDAELELPGEGGAFGKVVAIDFGARTVDIKKGDKIADRHPTSVFAHKVVNASVLADSLMRIGAWVADHGIDAMGPHRAARDLLLGRGPRLVGHRGGALQSDGESAVDAARRLALALDRGALAVQGPPGSGKTYTGARMILDLVRAGRRVGVCAASHKVVRNLMNAVAKAADEQHVTVTFLQKTEDDEAPPIMVTKENAAMVAALRDRQVQVAGGTPWLWARTDTTDTVDVLFVDEAGQMSLANVIAIAQCAKSIVLLGDPRQLEQPTQGTHPDSTAVSALEHVIGAEHQTIPADRGLFLAETWRLPPEICDFTSELFYERRLAPRAVAGRQVLSGAGAFDGAGLWFVPVDHDANQSASREEVAVVAELFGALLARGAEWSDRDGVRRPLGLDDILVVAPYNAQVADLAGTLPRGARVGTVDRFQGQEAPVVVFSLTTSTPEDAPRGMDFLYDPNRFNVATSRAMCACIVVGNPRLFAPDCQSPRHMKLANVFCRYRELATVVPLGGAPAA